MDSVVDLTDSPPRDADRHRVDLTEDGEGEGAARRSDVHTGQKHRAATPEPRDRSGHRTGSDAVQDAGERAIVSAAESSSGAVHCENVLLVLPAKVKVAGALRLHGDALAFTPEKGDASAHRVHVECGAVKSMQVSKEGSAKPLLKLVGCGAQTPDVTFDFSLVTNGAEWRNILKDAVAAIMRSSQESSSGSARPPKAAAVSSGEAAGGGVTPEESGAAGHSCASSLSGTHKGASAAGGQVYRLDAQTIYKFLTQYPKLAQMYQKLVPDKMSENDFWQRFLEAKNFHEGLRPGAQGSEQSAGAQDFIDRLAADKQDPKTSAESKTRLRGVDKSINLTAIEPVSSLRHLGSDKGVVVWSDGGGGAGGPEKGGVAGLIGYVNAHQSSQAESIFQERGDARECGSGAGGGVSKRRKVQVESEAQSAAVGDACSEHLAGAQGPVRRAVALRVSGAGRLGARVRREEQREDGNAGSGPGEPLRKAVGAGGGHTGVSGCRRDVDGIQLPGEEEAAEEGAEEGGAEWAGRQFGEWKLTRMRKR